MSDQYLTLLATYGEAVWWAHLVEDRVRLVVEEATRFKLMGYTGPKGKKVDELRFGPLIDELSKIFPDAGTDQICRGLHLFRHARNAAVHALSMQTAEDLKTLEGRDQIEGMLKRFSGWGQSFNKSLWNLLLQFRERNPLTVEALFNDPPRKKPMPDGTVTSSEIEKHLTDLDQWLATFKRTP